MPIWCAISGVVSPGKKDCIRCLARTVPFVPALFRVLKNWV